MVRRRPLTVAQKSKRLRGQCPGHAAYIEGLIDRLLKPSDDGDRIA
jgi:hypothetical protein